jgi:hypothetical protein
MSAGSANLISKLEANLIKTDCIKFTHSLCKLDNFSLLGRIVFNYEMVHLTKLMV